MSFQEFLWNSPPKHLALGRDEIHIWRATLDLPLSHIQLLEQTLAADERMRADRY
jgi:4'-phosphopantetheinyl transferase